MLRAAELGDAEQGTSSKSLVILTLPTSSHPSSVLLLSKVSVHVPQQHICKQPELSSGHLSGEKKAFRPHHTFQSLERQTWRIPLSEIEVASTVGVTWRPSDRWCNLKSTVSRGATGKFWPRWLPLHNTTYAVSARILRGHYTDVRYKTACSTSEVLTVGNVLLTNFISCLEKNHHERLRAAHRHRRLDHHRP